VPKPDPLTVEEDPPERRIVDQVAVFALHHVILVIVGPIVGAVMLLLSPFRLEIHRSSCRFPSLWSSSQVLRFITVRLVPTTIMHVHAVSVELKRPTTTKDVLDVWRRTPRVKFFRGAEGVGSTAQIMEVARDLSRNRADLYEIALWEDGVHVVGKTVYYFQAVHQESDVVPENVDAIRAMMQLESDAKRSMEMTDRSLGIPG